MQVLILRGLPGSGKSTFTRTYVEANRGAAIVSADDYFNVDGEYRFDPSKLKDAHKNCFEQFVMFCDRASRDIDLRVHTIIVDNCNIALHEIAPYVAYGDLMGFEVTVINFTVSLDTALERNIHGVPLHTLERNWSKKLDADRNWPRHWKIVESDQFQIPHTRW